MLPRELVVPLKGILISSGTSPKHTEGEEGKSEGVSKKKGREGQREGEVLRSAVPATA